MSRLRNRSALVTGAGQGIGRAVARRLADEGASVTVADLNADTATETVQLITQAGGSASVVAADVTDDEAIRRAVNHAVEFGGSLDVLVNNAQYFAAPKAFELVSMRDWELSEASGPKATFRFMQVAFPHLCASGRASVVNVTSGAALAGIKFTGPYAAAKGAILALTRVAANEWAMRGIRVNALSPFARTEAQAAVAGTEWDIYPHFAAHAPMGRGGDLEKDVAPAVAFLASEDARFITGSVLHVDGGLTELSSIDYSGMPGLHDA